MSEMMILIYRKSFASSVRYRKMQCALCQSWKGTLHILAYSMFFFKMVRNLKSGDVNRADMPDVLWTFPNLLLTGGVFSLKKLLVSKVAKCD